MLVDRKSISIHILRLCLCVCVCVSDEAEKGACVQPTVFISHPSPSAVKGFCSFYPKLCDTTISFHVFSLIGRLSLALAVRCLIFSDHFLLLFFFLVLFSIFTVWHLPLDISMTRFLAAYIVKFISSI